MENNNSNQNLEEIKNPEPIVKENFQETELSPLKNIDKDSKGLSKTENDVNNNIYNNNNQLLRENKNGIENLYENNIINNNISNSNDNENNNNLESKLKRRRRGKDEVNERNYRCPDCNKCYLSVPALTNHRKTKHNYGQEFEKKGRGRPRKEALQDDCISGLKQFYEDFFNNDLRKSTVVPQAPTVISLLDSSPTPSPSVELDTVKYFFEEIYNNNKNDLFNDFSKYDSIEKYPFYQIVVNNWEKNRNDYDYDKFCYNSIINSKNEDEKINTPPLDGIFFLYLKDISTKTNNKYFGFILKFLVTFREVINEKRKCLIKKKHQNEKRIEYTQIYNAETTPDICNDYFVDFLEPKNFLDMDKDELINLIQHFCFWLNKNQFTQSHLVLLE